MEERNTSVPSPLPCPTVGDSSTSGLSTFPSEIDIEPPSNSKNDSASCDQVSDSPQSQGNGGIGENNLGEPPRISVSESQDTGSPAKVGR